MLELAEDEARYDERAADESALHDIRDAAVDDHRGIEERTLLADPIFPARADVTHERGDVSALDGTGGSAAEPEHGRADDRREPPQVSGQERERECEEQPEHETEAGTQSPADEITCGRRLDPARDPARGKERDVWSAEPPEDRTRRAEKKNYI